jgi:hypothetical protein
VLSNRVARHVAMLMHLSMMPAIPVRPNARRVASNGAAVAP